MKRSTDDLTDTPLLKCYRTKSPCKVYEEPSNLTPVKSSEYIQGTLMNGDTPLRKSSCPPVITSAPYFNKRRSYQLSLDDGFFLDNDKSTLYNTSTSNCQMDDL